MKSTKSLGILAVITTLGALPLASRTAVAGGTNTGGSNESMNFSIDWCRSVASSLKEARMRAGNLYISSDFTGAMNWYLSGLKTALKKDQKNQQGNTLTARLLQRGIDLVPLLVNAYSGDLDGMQNAATAMEKYYDFVIKESKELDIPYFIPADERQKGCKDCVTSDPVAFEAAFEAKFGQFVADQLLWVADHFTKVVDRPAEYCQSGVQSQRSGFALVGGVCRETIALGSDEAYLEMVEKVTSETVFQDLNDPVIASGKACAVEDITNLNNDVRDFNLGDPSAYPNARVAISQATRQLREDATEVLGTCAKP